MIIHASHSSNVVKWKKLLLSKEDHLLHFVPSVTISRKYSTHFVSAITWFWLDVSSWYFGHWLIQYYMLEKNMFPIGNIAEHFIMANNLKLHTKNWCFGWQKMSIFSWKPETSNLLCFKYVCKYLDIIKKSK